METDSLRIRSTYPGLRPIVVGLIIGWCGAALVGLLLQHIQNITLKPIALNYLKFACVQSALSGAVTVFLAERSERHQWRRYISAALWSTVYSYGGALVIGFVGVTIWYCVSALGLAESFTVPAFGAAKATALGVAGFIVAMFMSLGLFIWLGAAALPFALCGSTLGALGSGLLCRLAGWPKAESQ